jgi:ABC-type transport system involved in multi-copper enzyme maturation permease subunit
MMSARATGAIVRSEGAALFGSWLLRGWLLLVAALSLLMLANIDQSRSVSRGLAGWLAAYSLPTAIMAGIVGTAALSFDLEVAADSVLSRAVTRADFVIGKVGARLALIFAGHFAVTLPAMFIAQRIGHVDADNLEIIVGSAAVAMTLAFIATLGALFGAVFRNALVAIATLMVAFGTQSLIFDFLGLDYLSPTALLKDMEDWLSGTAGAWEQARYLLVFFAATVVCLAGTLASFYRRDL